MAKLDLKRFRQDLKDAHARRDPGKPGRPATTGAMAVVRDNLDLFDRLRADDPALTWADIATSLGKQGVLQRNGQPITAKRLCAFVSTIRKQRTARDQAAERRRARKDVTQAGGGRGKPETAGQRRTLAPEMSRPEPPAPGPATEDAIRAERFTQHDKLFKQKD